MKGCQDTDVDTTEGEDKDTDQKTGNIFSLVPLDSGVEYPIGRKKDEMAPLHIFNFI